MRPISVLCSVLVFVFTCSYLTYDFNHPVNTCPQARRRGGGGVRWTEPLRGPFDIVKSNTNGKYPPGKENFAGGLERGTTVGVACPYKLGSVLFVSVLVAHFVPVFPWHAKLN